MTTGIGSGVGSQFGFKAETTYGTPVTVDRFVEFNTESLVDEMEYLQSYGIGSGRVARSTLMTAVKTGASGSIEFDVLTKGMGLLFKHWLGAAANAQQGGTAEYLQTYTLALTGNLLALTAQVAVPDTGGTIRTKTAEGVVVTAGTLSAALSEIVKLSLDVVAEQMVDTTAVATASYASGRAPFVYSQGALTVGGSSIIVKSFDVTVDNGFDTDRRGIGSTFRRQPIHAGATVITGNLDAEFESLTNWDAFLAGTLAQLVLTFTGGTIPTTSNPYKLVVTIPKIYYTGTTPTVGGPDIIRQPLPFAALYDGSSNPITITINTDDTTP